MSDVFSPEKKVDDDEILAVFESRSDVPVSDGSEVVGKWELSSQEVATHVNERLGLGEDDGISRQAIHRRLEDLHDVVKVKHGRTVTWRLKSDELLVSPSSSAGELEPEVGHKGPPIVRRLFGKLGMDSGSGEDEE